MVSSEEYRNEGEPDYAGGVHGETYVPAQMLNFSSIFFFSYFASLKFSGIFLVLKA